jgi:hypothetical protein
MQSGFYLRVQRDGKWQSLDIAEMTRLELEQFFQTREKEELIRWIVALAQYIQGFDE